VVMHVCEYTNAECTNADASPGILLHSEVTSIRALQI
jgi:hypothetical protein